VVEYSDRRTIVNRVVEYPFRLTWAIADNRPFAGSIFSTDQWFAGRSAFLMFEEAGPISYVMPGLEPGLGAPDDGVRNVSTKPSRA
jgi:hypothetical protein